MTNKLANSPARELRDPTTTITTIITTTIIMRRITIATATKAIFKRPIIG